VSVRTRRYYKKLGEGPEGLPLRWTVILAVAAAAGIGLGVAAGLEYGVATALVVTGLGDRVIR
jgi:hypothetical protein